jgi:hypothetical protein
MIVRGDGISLVGTRWGHCKPGFQLPMMVLSRLFRRLFLAGLSDAYVAAGWRSSARSLVWVVRWRDGIRARLGTNLGCVILASRGDTLGDGQKRPSVVDFGTPTRYTRAPVVTMRSAETLGFCTGDRVSLPLHQLKLARGS